jgi:hypothetical protein
MQGMCLWLHGLSTMWILQLNVYSEPTVVGMALDAAAVTDPLAPMLLLADADRLPVSQQLRSWVGGGGCLTRLQPGQCSFWWRWWCSITPNSNGWHAVWSARGTCYDRKHDSSTFGHSGTAAASHGCSRSRCSPVVVWPRVAVVSVAPDVWLVGLLRCSFSRVTCSIFQILQQWGIV